MDISLGVLNLTKEQQRNSYTLTSPVIKGFGAKDGEVTVVATRDLTPQEKTTLISQLQALPLTDIKKGEKVARKKSVLAKLKLDESDVQVLKELIEDGTSD